MKIIIEDMSIANFDAWSGGKDTKSMIIEAGKVNEFDSYVDELWPDGLTDTELNHYLSFDGGGILEMLGISEDEEDEELEEDED